jgi:predicted nucleotidyltransferase
MSKSPMIEAIDLIRTDVDAMPLADLEHHAQQVIDTLAGLNHYLNSPGFKSAVERNTALKRSKKLRLHLVQVRSLISAHMAAAAWIASAQADGSANLAQGAKVFGP